MKKYFVYDLETTGLDSKADILQMAGIYVEYDETRNRVNKYDAMNLYFAIDYEVPAKASIVNGLTRAKLNHLSDGLFFEDSYPMMRKFFEDPEIIAVGYNVLKYDKPVLLSNCERSTIPKPKWSNYYDVMVEIVPYIKKDRARFTNLRDAFYQIYIRTGKLTEEKTKSNFNKLFEDYIVDSERSYHDALYDSYITMLLLLYLLNKNAVR